MYLISTLLENKTLTTNVLQLKQKIPLHQVLRKKWLLVSLEKEDNELLITTYIIYIHIHYKYIVYKYISMINLVNKRKLCIKQQ